MKFIPASYFMRITPIGFFIAVSLAISNVHAESNPAICANVFEMSIDPRVVVTDNFARAYSPGIVVDGKPDDHGFLGQMDFTLQIQDSVTNIGQGRVVKGLTMELRALAVLERYSHSNVGESLLTAAFYEHPNVTRVVGSLSGRDVAQFVRSWIWSGDKEKAFKATDFYRSAEAAGLVLTDIKLDTHYIFQVNFEMSRTLE